MSPDEVMVVIVSSIASLFVWLIWFGRLAMGVRLRSPPAGLWLLALAPFACAAALFAVLRGFASHDVRDDPTYLAMYMVLGAAWVGLGAFLFFPLSGLSVRDDVVERRNPAAALAIAGALAGTTFAYAGGNIGDGPGWWVVVFASGLASGTLAVVCLALDLMSGSASLVTVDRDAAAGLRLGALLTASGIVLGRAAAGDWVTTAATLRDFAVAGWPVAPLVLAAAFIDHRVRPTPQRPQAPIVSAGLIPALFYVAFAVLYVTAIRPVQ